MADSDDDSDDWATEELPDIPQAKETDKQKSPVNSSDEGWESKLEVPTSASKPAATPNDEGEPMMLVDMTILSNDEIHSKFDPNAVNDVDAMKRLRNAIENDYTAYFKNTALVSNGTVIPCGSSVWRPALERMRRERPGHYFSPMFPPKK